MSSYAKSLFIFRRDLRLQDNTGLNQALNQSQQVIPCFIFDPQQIQPHPYQSLPGLVFMLESLASLQERIYPAWSETCVVSCSSRSRDYPVIYGTKN